MGLTKFVQKMIDILLFIPNKRVYIYEPQHVISNNVCLTSVDSDKPEQPFLSLESPNDVRSVA